MAVVLWGCPYKSSVPLSDVTEYVNKQIFGKSGKDEFEIQRSEEYKHENEPALLYLQVFCDVEREQCR